MIQFAWTQRVHRATMLAGQPRPGGQAISRVAVAPVPSRMGRHAPVVLPEPTAERLTTPVGELLRRRRSSFGGLIAAPPLTPARLGTVLWLTARTCGFRDDALPDGDPPPWTRLSVLVNHVTGIAPGGFHYDPARHVLDPAGPGAPDADWSELLARVGVRLANYNLDQAAAIIVISGRPDAAIAHCGPRGYRLLNARVGAVLQAGYLAATEANLGCGAVLNLDYPAIDEVLGFARTDERTHALPAGGG